MTPIAADPDSGGEDEAEQSAYAASPGEPWIHFRDRAGLTFGLQPLAGGGYDKLGVSHFGEARSGPAAGASSSRVDLAGIGTPRTLASADLDGDGLADLICGYARDGTGNLTLYRGNPHSMYREPGSSEPAFLSPEIIPVPEAADFVAAGRFGGDWYDDIVTAARGSNSLYLFRGTGRSFGAVERIHLGGEITALTAGDIGRRDGFFDILVGVTDRAGAGLLVFESRQEGLVARPIYIGLPAPVRAIALGDFDRDGRTDIATLAGSELAVLSGREPVAELHRQTLRFDPVALSVGDFIWDEHHRDEISLLSADGTVYFMGRDESRSAAWRIERTASLPSPAPSFIAGATLLQRAKVSALPADDLLVLDSQDRRIHVFLGEASQWKARQPGAHVPDPDRANQPVSFDVGSEPVAVLPVPLSREALDGLVVLGSDSTRPLSTAVTAASRRFTVNFSGDAADVSPGDGFCDSDTSSAGDQCTLRAAIQEANASPGTDEITFSTGNTITFSTPPPEVTDPVDIDGGGGFGGSIRYANGLSQGLTISAGNSTVERLDISSNFDPNPQSAGIRLISNGNNRVSGTSVARLLTGISIESSSNNTIAPGVLISGNVIQQNKAAGIQILGSSVGNLISGNSIVANGGLGIDLGGDGVTANDNGDAVTDPDTDGGPNHLQNFPELTLNGTAIGGSLASTPNTQFTIDFYSNPSAFAHCDPSFHGEGESFVDSITVTTDSAGTASFTAPFAGSADQFITATATDPANNTSEFSTCAGVDIPPPAPSPTPTNTPTNTPTPTVTPTGNVPSVTSTVSATVTPTQGGGSSCCVARDSEGGCDIPACQSCVCDQDSYCCEFAWDDLCVGTGAEFCGDVCPCEVGNDCCVQRPSPGCQISACETCVCAKDSFCCGQEWNQFCVALANTDCETECSCGVELPTPTPTVTPTPDFDCCSAHDAVGCGDLDCGFCACGFDPSCCTDTWGVDCVLVASTLCNDICLCSEAPTPTPTHTPTPTATEAPTDTPSQTPTVTATPDLDCCQAHVEPSCETFGCFFCVCGIAPSCCEDGWGPDCVLTAELFCNDHCFCSEVLPTPTRTPTSAALSTQTPTAPGLATRTPTSQAQPTVTGTQSLSTVTPTSGGGGGNPTATASPGGGGTSTATATSTAVAASTATPTGAQTVTATSAPSSTPTVTDTATATEVPTLTPSATVTATRTSTPSATRTWTPTFTDTPTRTPTSTNTPTRTPTFTYTATPTPTSTPTRTPTTTATPTSTQPPIVIRGTKFNDVDGNGRRDGGEPGLAGWTIYIDANANGRFDSGQDPSTVTAADGSYSFGSLTPGSYRVREVSRSGWRQTTPDPADISIPTAPSTIDGVDFGNAPEFTIRIEGEKFEDRNGDGNLDEGEPGLAGWVVFVDLDSDGALDNPVGVNQCTLEALEPCAITDAAGAYGFDGLGPGLYRVREVPQAGWTQTAGAFELLASSAGTLTNDIGNFRLGEVRGEKFEDLDGDGQRDQGEKGLPGWDIYLDLNRNGKFDSNAQTEQSPNVPVTLVDDSLSTSTLYVGGPAGSLADVDVTLNIAHPLPREVSASLVSPNGTRVPLFSDVPAAGGGENFSSTTFDDEAATGISDPSSLPPFTGSFRPEGMLGAFDGQSPIGLWTLEVRDGAPGVSGTVTGWSLTLTFDEPSDVTDGAGQYSLSGLGPDSYVVAEVPRFGFRQTRPTSGTYSVAIAQSGQLDENLDFGNRLNDLDGNGKVDDGDAIKLIDEMFADTADPLADLNGDGGTNAADIVTFLRSLGGAEASAGEVWRAGVRVRLE